MPRAFKLHFLKSSADKPNGAWLSLPSVAGFCLALLLTGLALNGCRPPVSVKTLAPQKVESSTATETLSSEDLTPETRQTLRLLSLDALWSESPSAVVSTLAQTDSTLSASERRATQAELLLRLGRRLEASDPFRSLGWYLLAAVRAYESLFESGPLTLGRTFDRRVQQTRDVYNIALGDYVRLRHRLGRPLSDHVQGAVFEIIAIQVATHSGMLRPELFDQIVPSRELKVKGFRNHYRSDGLGAALTVVRRNRRREPIDAFIPLEGQIAPATVLLTLEPQHSAASRRSRRATLAFYDPRKTRSINVGGVALPLAADFTTPYALLTGTAGNLERLGVIGLLQSEKALARQGLFLLEPYDPKKIPLIMVHGLRSSPLAWRELTNDLSGSPELSDAYQIWHYMYATSLPFLYSGRTFRQTLEDLRTTLDPSLTDPAVNSMVIVGHSMGGLLAKTLVTSSGSRLWRTSFHAAPEELNGLTSDIEIARQAFFFDAKPYVDRVIFIAVPHRGSDVAAGVIGRLGSGLVDLPDRFKNIFRRLTEANFNVVTEEMRHLLARGGPTSIRALSPQHPVIRELAQLPVDSSVSYHSILGDRGLAQGTEPTGTDGWVSYESAHLEGAASEKVFPARHDLYSHPLAISEVKRILRLHLEASDS